jgi:hypothetical protein
MHGTHARSLARMQAETPRSRLYSVLRLLAKRPGNGLSQCDVAVITLIITISVQMHESG